MYLGRLDKIMAGHSHWAGIKHKKGRADEQRSKIFSKLSREITVAAKLGDKDPEMNARLRSAIQAARSANMPKSNIEKAIVKSSQSGKDNDFENIRYEGFGPEKIAFVIETLTNNKNRTASSLRAIFQKSGGSLGSQGVASHNFNQLGVIRIALKEVEENELLDLSIRCGVLECFVNGNLHEIHCEKSSLYEVKKSLEDRIKNFVSTEIEWIPKSKIDIFDNERKVNILKLIEYLEEGDDVQRIFTNLKQ